MLLALVSRTNLNAITLKSIKSHPVKCIEGVPFCRNIVCAISHAINYFIFSISHFCQRNQMTLSAKLFISVMPDKHCDEIPFSTKNHIYLIR